MSDTEYRVQEIQRHALALVREKNARYQDSWRQQGWRGNLSRILEKGARLRAMLWQPGTPLLNGEKEHPRETALDMINTLTFMVINMDDGREWGHEKWGHEKEKVYATDGLTPAESSWTMDPRYPPPIGTAQQPPASYPGNGESLDDWPADEQQTAVNIPVPGEEPPADRPSPRRRDRGSGPRTIKDAPQS